jgi:hypothetical protein
MIDASDKAIPGIAVVIDAKAVRVTSERPLAGLSYAGPATTVGCLITRTMRAAIARQCREKAARERGRRVGW